MKRILYFGLLVSIIVIGGCMKQEKILQEDVGEEGELFISAAASLTDAMEDIVAAFEEAHPEIAVTMNFGGSGKIAQQIQQGAPVDVFLSADQEWMDKLAEADYISSESRINFATNELVLIAKKDKSLAIDSIEDLADAEIDQIAIGNPDSVPAGKYAIEALGNSGILNLLKEQFVYAKDVRQVLTYVETGNTEGGFVYKSDLRRADDIEVLAQINEDLYEPIVYPAAVVSSSKKVELANAFVSFLDSDIVHSILKTYGFK